MQKKLKAVLKAYLEINFSVRVYQKWSTKNMQDMIRNIA